VLLWTATGAVLDHERDQHLHRTHDQQDQHGREQQRGQQPRCSQHVQEPVAQITGHRPDRVLRLGITLAP
jgi:hypothetical protein